MEALSKLLAWVLLFSAGYPTCSGRINVHGSCPVNNYGCLQCLSRSSSNLERCYQQFIFITQTTTNNEIETERYCSGECPILLATSYYYCGITSRSIEALFEKCPSYSVTPTGSFRVNANYSRQHCLDMNSYYRCSHCIGDSDRDTVKCLQMYLLAKYANGSSAYIESYCSSECPVTLWSTSWYCGLGDQSDAYQICRRFGATYCIEYDKQSSGQLQAAIRNCQSDCSSDSCTEAKQSFGCCMQRRNALWTCPEVEQCPVHAMAATPDININGRCPFTRHGCRQCLSRNSDKLLRCEQLRLIITEFVSHDAEEDEFCNSQCPALLLSSRDSCRRSFRESEMKAIMNLCPSYNMMPTSSIDIRGNYSRQNCYTSSQSSCADCILSRSRDLTMCYQQYLLSQYANASQPYLNAFCASNCPVRLTTSNWYCNIGDITSVLTTCQKRDSDTFCAPLMRDNMNQFTSSVIACRADCSSQVCNSGKEMFGCCLRFQLQNGVCPNISSCILETSSATHPRFAATFFMTIVIFLRYVL